MAFKVKLQINRLGVAVANPTAIFGSFGMFTGDAGGEIEVEIETLADGITVLVPIQITDPSDGGACSTSPVLTDDEELTIEMSTQGKYTEPGVYTPPTP